MNINFVYSTTESEEEEEEEDDNDEEEGVQSGEAEDDEKADLSLNADDDNLTGEILVHSFQ